jgi:hypothetical protein
MQLQNIARASGGTYFDAPVGPELPDRLKAAFAACKQVVKFPANPKPGKLRTTATNWLGSPAVFNAESGKQVGTFDSTRHEVPLPAGIYEVQFGAARWKGIEVRPGETTMISPAVLQVNHIFGNSSVVVVDSETGERHGDVNRMSTKVTVMPGLYDLRIGSGGLVWPFVKIDGQKTVSLARVVPSRELKWKTTRVFNADGKEVATLYSAVDSGVGLPPGDYTVDVDGRKIPFKAEDGGLLEVKPELDDSRALQARFLTQAARAIQSCSRCRLSVICAFASP